MHVIGFKVETISDERRDRILVALIEVVNIALGGADELTMTFKTEETPWYNTKKKIEYTHKWTPADDLPGLHVFGITAAQRNFFETGPDIRTFQQKFRELLKDLKQSLAAAPSPTTTTTAAADDPPTEAAQASTSTDDEAAQPANEPPVEADAGAAKDSEASRDDLLGPFKRTIEDIERGQGYADDAADDN
ncbi:MAG: hypothetical protein IPP13_21760 [Kouleothrix sp.]|jgi:hypothetical protein|nr:hypothetical protein [Kouleothrix sp.]